MRALIEFFGRVTEALKDSSKGIKEGEAEEDISNLRNLNHQN